MSAPVRPRRAGALFPAAALAASLLLALVSCSDDEPATCPTFQVGAVQGYVRVAGSGAALTVAARALDGVGNGQVVASTVAADDGWYRLELGTGRYRLEVAPESIRVAANDTHDTLTVTPQVRRHDLVRGRAEFTMNLPDQFEGRWFTLDLGARGSLRVWLRSQVVDGEVRWVFPALVPATYTTRLSPLCGYPEGDSLQVGPDVVAVHEVNFRSTAAAIAGHVTGSWQQAGVAVPRVRAVDDRHRWISDADCDGDGAFTVTLLEPRTVRLQVTIDGREQWLGGDRFESARVFAPGAGERVEGADLVESGLDIRLQGPGDWLVQEAEILVHDDVGTYLGTVSANGGRRILSNLSPGRYYVQVDGACPDQIWSPQWYDGAASEATATPIDLSTGELRRLDIALATGGRIAGDLLTAAGGIPGPVEFLVRNESGTSACLGAMPLAGTRFEFGGLADGDYLLAAMATQGAWWWYPGTSDIAQADTISIADHAAVTGLSWRLPEEPGKARP